jgi:hypothetical protein
LNELWEKGCCGNHSFGYFCELQNKVLFLLFLMKKLKRFSGIFLGFLLILANGAWAQWSAIGVSDLKKQGSAWIKPNRAAYFQADLPALKNSFADCPAERPGKISQYGKIIALPGPDGAFRRFAFASYDMMEEELKQKWDFIRTYTGQGIDDPTAICKVDFTLKGFHAMVIGKKGTWFADPVFSENDYQYQVYLKSDFDAAAAGKQFVCSFGNEAETAIPGGPQTESVLATGGTRRVYRIAIACTGEYTSFHGGATQAASAIVTSLNRINGVYEKEVCIRMTLIANNNLLIYTNASSDPYSNSSGGTMLGQNQSTLTSVIGSANYDIGHVFSTGGGGIASKGSVCSSNAKAQGVTGSPSPVGDPFDVDYVAHEIGHQFGGDHTFNSEAGSCGGGNRASTAAYEPGSGTTIMAYAGICSTDNVQSNSDAYFHFRSYEQIIAFSNTGGGNSCAVKQTTGNNPPVVPAIPGTRVIPISTPFKLTAPSATDPDGNALTYCWEQNDLGPASTLSNPTGNAPLFRSITPVASQTRFFPRLPNIVANTSSTGERLPTTKRNLNFKLTVRDNNAGAGGVVSTTLQMTSDTAGGAFQVLTPNIASVVWEGGSSQTVTWRVGKTNLSPFNSPRVRIWLSTNGGTSFTILVKDSVTNDGSETILVPFVVSNTCRIMVESFENVFFDVSNASFRIIEPSVANIGTTATDTAVCSGQSFQVAVAPSGTTFNAGNIFTLQLSNASGQFLSPVSIGTVSSTGNATINATIPLNTASGTGYKLRIVSSNPVRTSSVVINAPKIKGLPSAAAAIQGGSTFCPGDSNKVYQIPAIAGAVSYLWTLPSGAVFQTANNGNSVTVRFGNTSGNITVTGVNACGNGQSSNQSVSVTQILPAQITASASSTVLCEGVAVQLSSSPQNGGTSPTYKWLRNNQQITGATSQTLNFPNPANGDLFSVVLTSSLSCGTPNVDTSNQVQIIVNLKKTPVSLIESNALNDTSCTGVDVTFTSTNNLAGGSSPQYAWFKNLTQIAGQTTSTLTINNLLSTDSVRLRLSVSGNCLTSNQVFSKGKKIAIINLQVNAGLDTVVCANAQAQLSGTPAGGNWTGPGVSASGAFLSANTGSVNLVYSYSAFGCLKTDIRAVNVLANPQATYAANGNILTAVTGTAYQWFKNGSPVSGANASTYTITETAEYCVEVTYANGCKSKSACTQQIFVSAADFLSDSEIQLFPNPVSDLLNVSMGSQKISRFMIYNNLGSLMYELEPGENPEVLSISTSGLPAGVYHVLVWSGNKTKSKGTFVKN